MSVGRDTHGFSVSSGRVLDGEAHAAYDPWNSTHSQLDVDHTAQNAP